MYGKDYIIDNQQLPKDLNISSSYTFEAQACHACVVSPSDHASCTWSVRALAPQDDFPPPLLDNGIK